MSAKIVLQSASRSLRQASRPSVVISRQGCIASRRLYSSSNANSTVLAASTRSRRPQIKTLDRISPPSTVASRRNIFIQTEDTPNVDALKFKPNTRILPEDFPSPFLEYMTPRSTVSPPNPSPLAAQLLSVEGVKSVFYGADFITVTKETGQNWAHIKPEVFALITQTVTSGEKIVTSSAGAASASGDNAGPPQEEDSLAYNENDSEVVGMIKELLETRIRPAIQEDGGDIEFRGFDDGMVKLKLRGACRTCDSSTVTLKNGIESMLMHYIEEVKGVQQVLDEEEEIALREFEKFEEKLRAQKGAVGATA